MARYDACLYPQKHAEGVAGMVRGPKARQKTRLSDGQKHPVTTTTAAKPLTLEDALPGLAEAALAQAGGDASRITVVSPSRVEIRS
jgi:hypothetical protein